MNLEDFKSEDLISNTNNPQTSFILENLIPDTIYTISVAALSEAGEGEISDELEVTTLAGKPVVQSVNTSIPQRGDDRTYTLGISRPSSINGPLKSVN